MAPTRQPKKLAKSSSLRSNAYKANELPQMEGDLLKVGRRTDKFVSRYYELKDSALIIYDAPTSLEPKGKT
jgi:hypothetical protein